MLSVHLCFGFAPHMGQRTDSICPSVSFAGFTFIVFRIAHLEDGQSCSLCFQSAPRPPSLTGAGVRKCDNAACWLITDAACVRRFPRVLLKSRVVTLCSQKVHLNVVPPFICLVV